MGFNQNPFVEKAQTAEQKAEVARDESARASAWLEAAHLWERAAAREKNPKRAADYLKKAEAARAASEEPADVKSDSESPKGVSPKDLN